MGCGLGAVSRAGAGTGTELEKVPPKSRFPSPKGLLEPGLDLGWEPGNLASLGRFAFHWSVVCVFLAGRTLESTFLLSR